MIIMLHLFEWAIFLSVCSSVELYLGSSVLLYRRWSELKRGTINKKGSNFTPFVTRWNRNCYGSWRKTSRARYFGRRDRFMFSELLNTESGKCVAPCSKNLSPLCFLFWPDRTNYKFLRLVQAEERMKTLPKHCKIYPCKRPTFFSMKLTLLMPSQKWWNCKW